MTEELRYYYIYKRKGVIMVNFFVGFISFAAIFAVCYIFCFALHRLKENMFKAKTKNIDEPKDIPPEQEQENPRVYYIASPPKKRKKRPKTQSIGLKGAMMPKGTVVIADAKALAKSTSQKTRHNNADTPPYKKTAKQLSAVKTTKQPRAYNKSKTKV